MALHFLFLQETYLFHIILYYTDHNANLILNFTKNELMRFVIPISFSTALLLLFIAVCVGTAIIQIIAVYGLVFLYYILVSIYKKIRNCDRYFCAHYLQLILNRNPVNHWIINFRRF
jgi:hypothetical protein